MVEQNQIGEEHHQDSWQEAVKVAHNSVPDQKTPERQDQDEEETRCVGQLPEPAGIQFGSQNV